MKSMVSHEFQQQLTPKKVRNYIISMKKHGFWKSHPIVWFRHKGKMMILWGHHRCEAAINLGISAWAQEAVELTLEDSIPLIQEENWNTWKAHETIKREVRLGNKSYEILNHYVQKGVPYTIAASLLHGESGSSCNQTEKVKMGTFKVKSTALMEKISMVIDVAPENAVLRNFNFIRALSRCLFVPEFDIKLLMRKIKSYPHLLEARTSVKDSSLVIEKLYNYHQSNMIPLSFLADQCAKSRNIIKAA